MIRLSSRAAATAIASLLLIGSAFAQTPAPAPAAAPAAKTDAKMAPADKKAARSAASLECSKEADGKSLHGKDRKKFMSECKKEAKAKAS
jgi:psiF repeat